MLYEVRLAANKGFGLFAKHTIPRGSRILAEKPLIALRPGQRPSDILSHAKQLDRNSRVQLLGLSWHPGNGIQRLGRWCEALGWVVRDRVTTSHLTSRREEDGMDKTSGPGRWIEMVRDLDEAVRILSIFRSNSFNLASSATLPLEIPFSRLSGSTESNILLETSAAHAAPCITNLASDTIMPSSSPAFELALFPAIARINHSCNPNAQANYHPMHQTFNIQATKNIPAGEEVSINYLPEHGQLREQRVAKLEEGYGFTCNCPACNIDTKEGQEVEERRKDMQRIIKKTKALFADSKSATETTNAGYGADGMQETLPNILSSEEQQQVDALRVMPDKDRQIWLRNHELEVLNAMIAMYQAEGIVGREVASIYYHMARLQQSTGSYEAAVATADAGLKLEKSCLGTDHPAYSEALTFVESIKKMPLAAARFR